MEASKLKHRRLKERSERIKVTISPANYVNNDKGELVVKNNPRMRLMLDKSLLQEQGFICDRLELERFDETRLLLIFKVTDRAFEPPQSRRALGRRTLQFHYRY